MLTEEQIKAFLEGFYKYYPEFKTAVDTGECTEQDILTTLTKVRCVYDLAQQDSCQGTFASYMLTAHFLCFNGVTPNVAQKMSSPMGLITSSSVGGVSVSVSAPKTGNVVEDFLVTSMYGREYLALISQITGMQYVN